MRGGQNFTSIFVLLSGGALAVLSYITLNISGSIDVLLSAIGSPGDPAQLRSILEIVIKLAVVLLILSMTLSILIIYNVTGRSKKLYHPAAPAIVVTTTRLREQYQTQSTQTWRLDELHWLVTGELDLALADQWTPPAIIPNSLAFLQYTSGSTGAPKGVMISHRNLLSNEAAIETAFGHTSASNVVGWLPSITTWG